MILAIINTLINAGKQILSSFINGLFNSGSSTLFSGRTSQKSVSNSFNIKTNIKKVSGQADESSDDIFDKAHPQRGTEHPFNLNDNSDYMKRYNAGYLGVMGPAVKGKSYFMEYTDVSSEFTSPLAISNAL